MALSPTFAVISHSRPNTAKGASFMTQPTTTMQAAWIDPIRSKNGRACSPGTISKAPPINAAPMTICSIEPSARSENGFCGMIPMMRSVSGKSPPTGAMLEARVSPAIAAISPLSICRPGCRAKASAIPITTASAVMAVKIATTRPPIARSVSISPPAAIPRTTDARISGTTTNLMSARNRWPGKASHSTRRAIQYDGNSVVSPRKVPTAMPIASPTNTFSHSLSRLIRPSGAVL